MSPRWVRAIASLKFRITLSSVAALALGIGLTASLLVQRATLDTLSAERKRELSETARSGALLSRRVVTQQLALLAASRGLTTQAMSSPQAMADFLADETVLRGMFTEVFVADTDGRIRAVADARRVWPTDEALRALPQFYEAVRQRHPTISHPIKGRDQQTLLAILFQPVVDPSGVIGVLGGTLRVDGGEMVDGLMEQDDDLSQLIVVTDSRGRILAHTERQWLMQELAVEPRMAQAFTAWKRAGSPIERAGMSLPQPGEVVSAAGVPGPDWMIWRARKEGELLAPLRAARRHAIGWSAALVGMLSAAMLLLLYWLLRPLSALGERAAHLVDKTRNPSEGWPRAGGEIGRLAGILRRVAIERTSLEVANSELLRRLESIMAAAPVGIAVVADDRIVTVSGEFCRLMNCSSAQATGMPTASLFADAHDAQAAAAAAKRALRADGAYAAEWRIARWDATTFWGSLRCRPVDANDAALGSIWTIVNIDEQKRLRERLEWSALHDTLTGAANRTLLGTRAAPLLAHPRAHPPASLVYIDLDHFKPINDTAGHLAGDAMLKSVADVISEHVRPGDLVVRLGGDEFALLLEGCDEQEALNVARRVHQGISAIRLAWSGVLLRVGASMGVARLRHDMRTLDDWIACADAALYLAKLEGRGHVRLVPAISGEGSESGKVLTSLHEPVHPQVHRTDARGS